MTDSTDERRYYLCKFLLDGTTRFVIWFSDEDDGLITSPDGKIPTFNSAEDARAYAAQQNIPIDAREPSIYDFDSLESWCKSASADSIDCSVCINAWNMFLDIASSAGGASLFIAADEQARNVYRKLFWGLNLPSMAPKDDHYVPVWSDEEVALLVRVLTLGRRLLQSAVAA